MPRPLLFVDACTWINLIATGQIREIVRAVPFQFAASHYVAVNEVLTVHAEQGSSGETQRFDLLDLQRSGDIKVFEVETRVEVVEFVRFAAELDDGEATTCALAVSREGGVATDDRKALRVLARLAPEVPVHQTPELLQRWASFVGASENEIRRVLTAVRDRGRFYPRGDAPGFAWWRSFLP